MNESSAPRRLIYRGLKIDLALQSVPLANGTYAEREVVVHRGAVALVPMVDAQHVCLVENQRYSVGKTLLEVPAGTIDQGDWYVSPGVMTERMYLFLCEDLEPGPPHLELDEQLKTVIVPWEQALAMVDDGRIEDAKTMLALTICDRLRRQ
jgi:ADP-ribose pyrophosphatase